MDDLLDNLNCGTEPSSVYCSTASCASRGWCLYRTGDIDRDNKTLGVAAKRNREAKAVFTDRTVSLLRGQLSSNGHSSTLFAVKAGAIQDTLNGLSKQSDFPCNARAFRRSLTRNLHKRGLCALTTVDLGPWSSLEMVARYTRSSTFDDCLKHHCALLS